ncbi:MAG: DUF2341 domain-containing protein [Candidatus Nanohaloarchaeota archaeon QJJ-9]|nr:DUF2341 domain-containing protein [Candidatus Nanohaloarchaeota archaeon QJJ-9]
MNRRKAQFFILTAVLVAGSLSITMEALDDYTQIGYTEISESSFPMQVSSIANTIEKSWYSESWNYRKTVKVFETSGRAVENFPVSFDINSSALISSDGLKSDCGDLRVVEDGEEIPYQIEEGECDSENTTVWFMVSLEPGESKDVYLYYGNKDIEEPTYGTDLYMGEDGFGNSQVDFVTGSFDGGEGVSEVNVQGEDITGNGGAIYEGSPSFDVVERGEVYMDVELGGETYRLFSDNQFLRWLGSKSLDPGFEFWYGENDGFSHWEAGNESNSFPISNYWSGSFSEGSLPYLAAYNASSGNYLAAATSIRQSNVDGYGFENRSLGQYMNFSSEDNGDIPYIDFLVGKNGINHFRTNYHTVTPRVELLDGSEEFGKFNPTDGWNSKVRVSVKERNGSYLEEYPVNLSLNLGRMDTKRDCSDLVVVEDGDIVPHRLASRCDSLSFEEPDNYFTRWDMDGGEGDRVHSTDGLFYGELTGSPQPEWDVGRFGLGLRFDGDNYVEVPDSHNIDLYDLSYTLSLWFRGDVNEFDYDGGKSKLFYYPEESPGLSVVNETGYYYLQASFRNETGDLSSIREDISSYDSSEWHHVSYVYNKTGSEILLYIDGDQKGSQDVKGSLETDSDSIKIGEGLKGYMDEIKLYTTPLEAREIRDQYVTTSIVTFKTNLSAGEVERDVAVFVGNNAGLDKDFSGEFPAPNPLDSDHRPVVVSKNTLTYSEMIGRISRHIEETSSLASFLDISVEGGCAVLDFDAGSIKVNKRIC